MDQPFADLRRRPLAPYGQSAPPPARTPPAAGLTAAASYHHVAEHSAADGPPRRALSARSREESPGANLPAPGRLPQSASPGMIAGKLSDRQLERDAAVSPAASDTLQNRFQRLLFTNQLPDRRADVQLRNLLPSHSPQLVSSERDGGEVSSGQTRDAESWISRQAKRV